MKKQKVPSSISCGHPSIWAVLTLLAFPIVLVTTNMLGVQGLRPFWYALIATFVVLLLEALVRGRLWPFEDGFIESIGHPETPFRIFVFLGSLLLLIETVFIFSILTDKNLDQALVRLVAQKNCTATVETQGQKDVCRLLTQVLEVENATASQ